MVTLAEIAAKYTIGSSVANSVRPRRYYKIPKETLEATLDDVEQLINFFVIEFQRIVFAEHIPTTATVSVFKWDPAAILTSKGLLYSFHQLLPRQTSPWMGICPLRYLRLVPRASYLHYKQGVY